MITLGTALILLGFAGLLGKAWGAFKDTNDPPRKFRATVARTRLDTKKIEGREYYTYIITFLLQETGQYVSFEVPQKIFDEILDKDNGVLTCKLNRKIFLAWEFTAPPKFSQ